MKKKKKSLYSTLYDTVKRRALQFSVLVELGRYTYKIRHGSIACRTVTLHTPYSTASFFRRCCILRANEV